MPESVEDPAPPVAPLPSAPATRAAGGTDPDRAARDRDDDGRARQARPRDALGRPLPYGAQGVEPVSEDPLPPLETVATAFALLAEGRPFSAHEVFEARWKDGPEEERDLWQGLAQLCVAITHARRGNTVGARTLLERGTQRLQQYAATAGPTYGVVLQTFVSEAREAVTQMKTMTGSMTTDRPERYAKQLSSHWAHRGPATKEDGATVMRWETGQVIVLRPSGGGLRIEVSVPDDGDVAGFAQVVKQHLERFGKRAELNVVWDD